MRGLVARIQRFSTGDGPGIRTTVFLKGCNLRCRWCHNPELIAAANELSHLEGNCVDCRECVRVCAEGAWRVDRAGRRAFDASRCTMCGACAEHCSYDATNLVARWMEPEEVLETVLRDRGYYKSSGGGLTLSGGEPLLQPGFARALLEGARERGIHTALDTAAAVPSDLLEGVLPATDLVLLDLKLMDSAAHRRWTGAPNEQILENARHLSGADVDLVVRVPVVAGVNDSEENMAQTAELVRGFPRLRGVELLPCHDLGADKVKVLQRPGEQERFAAPSPERMQRLSGCLSARGVRVLTR